MARGVWTRIPARAKNRRSYTVECDTCGIVYYDHQVVEMEDGLVRCLGPGTLNDAKGRVGVTLSRLNAERAKTYRPPIRLKGSADI